jgi:hypothetical protein
MQVLTMRFAGCAMEYQDRLAINSEPAETHTYSANLGDLSRSVTVAQASRPDDVELPRGPWWAVVIRDGLGLDRIRVSSQRSSSIGTALATFQLVDRTMARRLANALSAAIERCGGSA